MRRTNSLGFIVLACGLVLVSAWFVKGLSATPASNGKSLLIKSPALSLVTRPLKHIPDRYRCRAGRIWFPLEWGEVPEETREIAVGITVNKILRRQAAFASELSDEWIIGNLDPSRRRLLVGPLPTGAFLKAHGSFFHGKFECPSRNLEIGLEVSVYALPADHRLERVETIGLSTIEAMAENALASGSMVGLYGRSES
jgi:phosphatidylethanolamine-binding protein (PEBP) family uncharacterized protein